MTIDKELPMSLAEVADWIPVARQLFSDWIEGGISDKEALIAMQAHEFIALCRPIEGEDEENDANTPLAISRARDELEAAAAPLMHSIQLLTAFRSCSVVVAGDDGTSIRRSLYEAWRRNDRRALMVAGVHPAFA